VFTGIVEGIGAVRGFRRGTAGLRLEVDLGACAEGVQPGDSVAVSGVCLTVVDLRGSLAAFDVSPESLEKSILEQVEIGRKYNLERSLRMGDRLGGHFVTGHVDAVGMVLAARPEAGFLTIEVEAPAPLRPLLAQKGSISVDGVSLTIASLTPAGFTAALIPETLARTTLGAVQPGQAVNLEADLIAKHVARLLAVRG
jgi:riboflavin synthase